LVPVFTSVSIPAFLYFFCFCCNAVLIRSVGVHPRGVPAAAAAAACLTALRQPPAAAAATGLSHTLAMPRLALRGTLHPPPPPPYALAGHAAITCPDRAPGPAALLRPAAPLPGRRVPPPAAAAPTAGRWPMVARTAPAPAPAAHVCFALNPSSSGGRSRLRLYPPRFPQRLVTCSWWDKYLTRHQNCGRHKICGCLFVWSFVSCLHSINMS